MCVTAAHFYHFGSLKAKHLLLEYCAFYGVVIHSVESYDRFIASYKANSPPSTI